MDVEADYVFEASWEVCNKVGGIYTVVKSKAPAMVESYKNYFLVGPYVKEKADVAFESKQPPKFLEGAFSEMEKLGVKCHFGTWLVEGDPDTILIEGNAGKRDEVRKWLWENYNVDSLMSSWDFDEPMLWAWTVGVLMEKVCGRLRSKKVVLHAHEWLSGFSILYAKKNCKAGTVFTTHATMLGRTLAGSGFNLYEILDDIDPESKAKELGVADKFTTERACAHAADVFTTVSEITGLEAEKLLGRKPDVLLENGLNVEHFPTLEEASIMHIHNRDDIREFLTWFFFPYYAFELEHTLIYYMVGRYEFANKGVDVVIDALGKVNDELKKTGSKRNIVMFFWIPTAHKGIRQDVVENKNYYLQIKNTLDRHSGEIMTKLLRDMVSQSCSVEESIFTSEYVKKLKKEIMRFRRSGNPPVSTHYLVNEGGDPIVHALLRSGLDNKEDDRVKVLMYPVYLDGNDNLLNMGYYDALSAGHLGLYPSYYEPWGYTPVESMSMGVPAVTTDLSGFGRFIKPHMLDKYPGIYLLGRHNKKREEVVQGLYEIMMEFAHYDHAERVQNKINAKQMSVLTDWKHFVKKYIEAHNKAISKP